jgi:hypothetical protein
VFLRDAFTVTVPGGDHMGRKTLRQFILSAGSKVAPQSRPRRKSGSLYDLRELRPQVDSFPACRRLGCISPQFVEHKFRPLRRAIEHVLQFGALLDELRRGKAAFYNTLMQHNLRHGAVWGEKQPEELSPTC